MDIFGGSTTDASNVDYDNVTSGLTATDVQEALDEVAASGSGDVTGPASATDNAITRFDGTTGKLIKESTALLASESTMLNAGTPTYTTVQDSQTISHSSGWASGGVITDAGAGTINVAAGEGFIRSGATSASPLYFSAWPQSLGLALTDNTLNYVYIDYNSGTPIVAVSTTAPNEFDQTCIGTVYRSGTTLHITMGAKNSVGNHASLMIARNKALGYIKREEAGGAIVTHTGTNNLSITEGRFWIAVTSYTTNAIDTSVSDTFFYFYNIVSPTSYTTVTPIGQTTIDNLQYDNAGTLATLGNGRYGVHFVYIGSDSDVYVIYGTGSYNLTDAENAAAPTIVPGHFEKHATLIAKIIIAKSATGFTDVLSAFANGITYASVSANVVNGVPADNEITRFDTNGNTIQGSGVTMDDNGYINVGVNTNVCIGNAKAILTGADNVIVGRTASNMSLGASNVLIGNAAGDGISTGTDNICIGDNVVVGNGSNRIAIGSTAEVTADYEMAIGGSSTTWRIDKVRPGRDGECDLGDTTHQFKDIYISGDIIGYSPGLTAGTPAVDGVGTAGAQQYDSDYLYTCVATNTWKRTPLSTYPWVVQPVTGANCTMFLSVRQKSTYSGNCVRLVSGATDIGFDADFLCSKTEVEAVVGAGLDAQISVLYDQSGNGYNLDVTTLSVYVRFVTSNGRSVPTIYYPNNNCHLSNTTTSTTALGWGSENFYCLAGVKNADVTPRSNGIFGGAGSTGGYTYVNTNGTDFSVYRYPTATYDIALPAGATPHDGALHTYGLELTDDGATSTGRIMYDGTYGITPVSSIATEADTLGIRLGSQPGAAQPLYGFMPEVIMWNAQPSAAIVSAIESSMRNIWE